MDKHYKKYIIIGLQDFKSLKELNNLLIKTFLDGNEIYIQTYVQAEQEIKSF